MMEVVIVCASGGGITDGYNSASGPYNPVAVDSTGSLATNGNISLTGGGTTVKGDAAAAGTNSGGGDLYGAIVGRSLNSSGGSKVHYDEALTQLPSKTLVTVSGSWAEVSAF